MSFLKRKNIGREEDRIDRRMEQAKLEQTRADSRANLIRIARLEGAVRVLTSRAGKVGS